MSVIISENASYPETDAHGAGQELVYKLVITEQISDATECIREVNYDG